MSAPGNPRTWDEAVLATQHTPHFMQSMAWAEFKTGSGWTPAGEHLKDAAGNDVLAIQEFRRPAFGLGTLIHAPRVAGINSTSLKLLTEHAQSHAGGKFLSYKIETFQQRDPVLIEEFIKLGWVPARASQYRWAVTVQFDKPADDLFAGFSKHHRRDIRAAQRSDAVIERVEFTEENIATALQLIRVTESRSGAFFRSEHYLRRAWDTFNKAGQARLYFTKFEDEVLAAAVVFTFGKQGWYKDGGSVRTKKVANGPLLMQWTIMQDLMADGFTHYELGNIPDPQNHGDSSMQGLYRFKSGFTETPDDYMPAFEYPLNSRSAFWRKNESKFLSLYRRLRRDYWY